MIEYCNPIIDRSLADPFILRAEGEYFLIATGAAGDGRYLPIYRSKNLATWEFVRGAVAKGEEGTWNRRNFWAPEIIQLQGKYYLYYTASVDGTPQNTGNRVGLAISDHPDGPYEDAGVVVPNASLDGSPFLDSDGKLYLYYTIEHGNSSGLTAGQIFVDRLITPDQVSGSPVAIITHYGWQEGPCVILRNGRYYLTFSTGSWETATYTVRQAVGNAPTGPFKELPGRILESTDQVKGPGHNNIFTGPDGHDWIVYHGWDPQFTGRFPRIDPITITPNGLSTIGPTVTPQEIGHRFWQSLLDSER